MFRLKASFLYTGKALYTLIHFPKYLIYALVICNVKFWLDTLTMARISQIDSQTKSKYIPKYKFQNLWEIPYL